MSTTAPQSSRSDLVDPPISDANAHVTFYLVALKEATPRVSELLRWVRDSA